MEMSSLQHKISCEPQTTEVADKRRRQEKRLEQLRCRCTPHVVRCIRYITAIDSDQLMALYKLNVEV
ncbi:MAG: hypothetical protein HUU49_00020 [Candidatus Buchananbacteria bacterium]|nr:hypothetical protein [Candidatus Buchananbacteria bacterium]